MFRGAGWNVIKVIWGSLLGPAASRRTRTGILLQAHGGVRRRRVPGLQGEGRRVRARAFLRQYPELKAMVADMSDDDIWRLNRGGHDPHKVYAAYAAAVKHKGQPTVILAKTIKGYGMGESGEGQKIAHQPKKMTQDALKQFRDRFHIPIPDDKLDDDAVHHAARGQPGDEVPARAPRSARRLPAAAPAQVGSRCEVPPLVDVRAPAARAPATREISTTMAFVRMLGTLVRDKEIGKHVVPIVPDESRTFGMEGMFRQLGIYSARRPALQAAGRRPADVLPRGQDGPDPAGRHQRSRRDVARGSPRRRRTARTTCR